MLIERGGLQRMREKGMKKPICKEDSIVHFKKNQDEDFKVITF